MPGGGCSSRVPIYGCNCCCVSEWPVRVSKVSEDGTAGRVQTADPTKMVQQNSFRLWSSDMHVVVHPQEARSVWRMIVDQAWKVTCAHSTSAMSTQSHYSSDTLMHQSTGAPSTSWPTRAGQHGSVADVHRQILVDPPRTSNQRRLYTFYRHATSRGIVLEP